MLLDKLFILDIRILILVVLSTEDMIDKLLYLSEIVCDPFGLFCFKAVLLKLLIKLELIVSYACSSSCVMKVLFSFLSKQIVLFCGSSC